MPTVRRPHVRSRSAKAHLQQPLVPAPHARETGRGHAPLHIKLCGRVRLTATTVHDYRHCA
eukprot:14645853-Heterocapsa_arctica.AAC.1